MRPPAVIVGLTSLRFTVSAKENRAKTNQRRKTKERQRGETHIGPPPRYLTFRVHSRADRVTDRPTWGVTLSLNSIPPTGVGWEPPMSFGVPNFFSLCRIQSVQAFAGITEHGSLIGQAVFWSERLSLSYDLFRSERPVFGPDERLEVQFLGRQSTKWPWQDSQLLSWRAVSNSHW